MTAKPNEPEGLEPCPFCGEADYLTVPESHAAGMTWWQVECGCGAFAPTGNTKAEAIAAWNRRVHANPVADAGGVTEDDVIGLINIVTDLAEVDALDKAYPEVWGRLDAMVNHAVAAATAAKDAEIARLRSVIKAVADGIDLGDDCWQRLYETMCCNGDDCGCMASSWAQLTVHDLRAALSEAREAGAKD